MSYALTQVLLTTRQIWIARFLIKVLNKITYVIPHDTNPFGNCYFSKMLKDAVRFKTIGNTTSRAVSVKRCIS